MNHNIWSYVCVCLYSYTHLPIHWRKDDKAELVEHISCVCVFFTYVCVNNVLYLCNCLLWGKAMNFD